jgi:hypothetical protein
MIGVTLHGSAADPLIAELIRAIKDRVPLCPDCGWPEDANHVDVLSLGSAVPVRRCCRPDRWNVMGF